MVSLSPEAIKLRAVPQSKQDAIDQVGQLLVESGHIRQGISRASSPAKPKLIPFWVMALRSPMANPKIEG